MASEEEKGRADELLAGARWFARRLDYNAQHAEQVSRLALSLFDQLRPIHEMGAGLRGWCWKWARCCTTWAIS